MGTHMPCCCSARPLSRPAERSAQVPVPGRPRPGHLRGGPGGQGPAVCQGQVSGRCVELTRVPGSPAPTVRAVPGGADGALPAGPVRARQLGRGLPGPRGRPGRAGGARASPTHRCQLPAAPTDCAALQAGGKAKAREALTFDPELTAEDVAYLRALPFSLSIPSHGVLVVHAGLVPGVPLQSQQLEDLIEVRAGSGPGGCR